jgi:hypothetical protein
MRLFSEGGRPGTVIARGQHAALLPIFSEIGYDGIWRWGDLALIVEVKTSDAYTINTSTLVGYIDRLIEAKSITDWDHALDLYVLGRADPGITQLEHSIVGQRRTHQLRVATVETILSLADLRQNDLISVDEAVALLKPTTVRVDDIVGILTRVAAQTGPQPETETTTPTEQKTVEIVLQPPLIVPVKETAAIAVPTKAQDQPLYLLTPVADDEHGSAKDTIKRLLDQGWYVFRTTTPGRKPNSH